MVACFSSTFTWMFIVPCLQNFKILVLTLSHASSLGCESSVGQTLKVRLEGGE